MEMNFVSLLFLNERNITISLLMIHLECIAVHYANINSSYLNKPDLWGVKYTILFFFFFSISYLFFLRRSFFTLTRFILTLPDPCISESCIEIEINVNFYFHIYLLCLKRFYESLKGKPFSLSGIGTGKENVMFSFLSRTL